jgi:hypothetical protein
MKGDQSVEESQAAFQQTVRRNVELAVMVYGHTMGETKNPKGERVPVFLFDDETRKLALTVIHSGLKSLQPPLLIRGDAPGIYHTPEVTFIQGPVEIRVPEPQSK